MGQGTTSILDYNSDLIRRQWIKDGVAEARKSSFWDFAMGKGADAIIRQKRMKTATEGHNIIFDYQGALEGTGFKNKETAYGKGESKKRFSDRVTIDMWRFPVYNGTKWDATKSANLNSTEHSDSRRLLMDVWTKLKDQAVFDCMQFGSTHRYIVKANATKTFSYDDLVKLELAVKSGNGFVSMTNKDTKMPKRFPLLPYKVAGGKDMWLLVCDSYMLSALFLDPDFKSSFQHADVRGNDNRLISGALGTIRSFVIMDSGTFLGKSKEGVLPAKDGGLVDAYGYAQFNATRIMGSGLRTYRGADGQYTPQSWEGDLTQTGAKVFSRGLVVGRRALQFAIGMDPDYNLEWSRDHKIDSESCLITWVGMKPVKLLAEGPDYHAAEAAGISFGFIAVDMQLPDEIGQSIIDSANAG